MATGKTRLLVAIAGGTCSGKSTAAAVLNVRFARSVTIQLDDFYFDLRDMTEADTRSYDFDSPQAFDADAAVAAVEALLAGSPAYVPAYDRRTHRRLDGRRVNPADLILLDGMYAIALAERMDQRFSQRRVYCDCSEGLRRQRREMREIEASTVSRSFAEYWAVAEHHFNADILPQRSRAELVLDTSRLGVLEELLAVVARWRSEAKTASEQRSL